MYPISIVGKKFVQYTDDEYKKNDKFPYYCPKDKPNMCTLETPNYGLCKHNIEDCDNYEGEYDMPIMEQTTENLDTLKQGYPFNYIFPQDQKDAGQSLFKENVNRNCLKLSVVKEGSAFSLPKKFKIMTYNIWHSLKKTSNPEQNNFELNFLELRVRQIAKIIIKSKTDIVCLQEVSLEAFNILKPLLETKYKYYYENEFIPDENNDGKRGRIVETMCFSKYPASYKLFTIEGNLSYNNSAILLEFDNAVVFNVYLQAGTSKSPGQKFRWIHYSRCRYNQYLGIGKYLQDNNIKKPVIILGDFNTNLDGNENEWYELRAFRELNLTDSWKSKYPDLEGFTEDTKTNYMRWNTKFEEKQYRIDGIFYTKDVFTTDDIEIMGTKHICDETKDNNRDCTSLPKSKFLDRISITEIQKDFLKYRVAKNNGLPKGVLRGSKTHIWPSDHFAVMSSLSFNE